MPRTRLGIIPNVSHTRLGHRPIDLCPYIRFDKETKADDGGIGNKATPPFQIIGLFDFSKFIHFVRHLDYTTFRCSIICKL